MKDQTFRNTEGSPETEGRVVFDLADLGILLKKYARKLVALLMLGGILAAGATALFTRPVYSSSATLFLTPVVNESGSIDYDSQLANTKLVNNVILLMTQDNIMSSVAKDVGMKNAEDVRRTLKVSNAPNTELIVITCTTGDAKLSKDIAVSTVNNFTRLMKTNIQVRNIEIVAQPRLNYEPVGPNIWLNTAAGAGTGLFAGLVFVLFRLVADKHLRNSQEAERYLHIPVYCELPDMEHHKESGR